MEIINVFDNKGYTVDRYTLNVITEDGGACLVACSDHPTHPMGVWSVDEGTYILPEDIEENDKHIGVEIEGHDLPIEVQKTVEQYFES